MSIILDEKNMIFHLNGGNTSYIMQVFKEKYLVHLYWGKRLHYNNLSYLNRPVFRPFSPATDVNDLSWSLDTLLMEYPAYGNSDFREPAFSVQMENGSTITNALYKSYKILKGKPNLQGLPAIYAASGDEVQTLEIVLEDDINGLEILLSYTIFDAYDAIMRNVRFTNHGNQNLKLLKAMSMSVDFSDCKYEMLQLSGSYARERDVIRKKLTPGCQMIESKRGFSSHQQNPFIALVSPGTDENFGDVYGFSLVYSGNFVAGAEVDQYNTTRLFAGINPFDFSWLLEPGQSFQTPETVMVYSCEGIGGMSRIYHRLFRTRLCRGEFRDKVRPVLINNWEATFFNFTAPQIESFAKEAAELGIDLLVLDDGWFGQRDDSKSSLGDWFEHKRKLPEGLKGLGNKINQMGMQFGLWFEPEMISPDSELYMKHPDWCLHVQDRNRTQSRYQLVLDLSRDDVCEAVIEMIANVIKSNPISYVKWDSNRSLTEIGSDQLPPERQRETAHRYVLGLYKVMQALTDAFPHVLFESCASGGGRFDPGMLYYMPQTWASDCSEAADRLIIQYGTSIVYPVITMGSNVTAVPSFSLKRTTSLSFRGSVAMSANMGYQLDLTKLTPEEKEAIKKQIVEYKEIRELVLFGDMYRLKSPFEGNETAWMFVSGDKKEAFVAYFRSLIRINEGFERLKLNGLNPDLVYKVIDSNESYHGDALMNAGINIPASDCDFSVYTWKLRA